MIKRELLDIIYLSTREPSDSVFQAGLIPRNPEIVDAPKCKAQTGHQAEPWYHKLEFPPSPGSSAKVLSGIVPRIIFNCNQGTKNSCTSAFNTLQEWKMTHEALTSCGASLSTPQPLTNAPRQAGTAAWNSGVGLHILGVFLVKYFRRVKLILNQ